MSKNKLVTWSFIDAVGTLLYITAVTTFMGNAEKIFGQAKTVAGPIVFLLLFVVSAAITSALILGRPILMYLSNFKKESLLLFFYTLGWLVLFLATILSISILV